MFNYDEPLYRPPSEAHSLILQISIGCSWNSCAFCEMYKSKRFKVKPWEEIEQDILNLKDYYSDARKVFLADGDALSLETDILLRILKSINTHFPNVRRISAYASARDVNSKTKEELELLAQNGLKLVYIGLESGCNEVLKAVNKGENHESYEAAFEKLNDTKIDASVMILNALGGKKHMHSHALESARLINTIKPKFLSLLSLNLPYGVEKYQKLFKGDYQEMDALSRLVEMKEFIENLDENPIIFRSNHVSNYLVLSGNIDKNKTQFIQQLNTAIDTVKDDGFSFFNRKGGL